MHGLGVSPSFQTNPCGERRKKLNVEKKKIYIYIPHSARFPMIFPVSFWSIFSPGGVLPIGLPGGPTAGAIMWRDTQKLRVSPWKIGMSPVEVWSSPLYPKKRSEPTENGEFTKWKCKFGQEICRCCNWEDLGIDPTRMEQTWKDMYQCIHRYPLPTNVRNRMGNQKGKDVSWACPETDRFVTPLGKMPY